MTRLTFNQVSEKFTAMGYTLEKMSKGYKVVAIEDIKFARLEGETSAMEWLDKQMNLASVEPEATTAPAPQADMENCDDLTNLACSLTSGIDQNPLWDGRACELTCELPNVETYRYYVHTDRGMIPVESIADSEETFANSGIFDNCVNVGRWDNGNIKSFNSETLWCELQNTRAQNNTEVVPVKPTTAINHGQVGLVVVLMVIEFLKLTAVLIGFTLAFTYSLIRRTAINQALIYDSFKSAVNVAKRTLQTA